VNDRPLEEYIFPANWQGWKWDKARWGDGGKVADVIEALTKVRPSSLFPVLAQPFMELSVWTVAFAGE
jgi:hypothetical protein